PIRPRDQRGLAGSWQPRWLRRTSISGEPHAILQRSEEVIEGDLRLLQDMTQCAALDRAMSRDGNFDSPIGQLLLESNRTSPPANHGESQPIQARHDLVVVLRRNF